METRWIWPFELLDKLGEGGMGVVYRARYVGNNRQVAVKLIPDDITANPTLLARFERELDVLKQLKHPNIVYCFGGRCERKQRYYAMELLPGGTLAEHLAKKGKLLWETAVDFAIQMCAALQYAHEHGVVHRDIKPGNFLLTKSGQLKLSDFGLASIVCENRLTAAGRTVGTILYMAPEQIRGGALDSRADLYALGCVIYEMLVGEPPFTGNNAAEVLQRHLKDPIPHIARRVPECPLELDSLVCELLAKDADRRPATAADVADRLQGILLPGHRGNPAELDLFSKPSPKGGAVVPLKDVKKIASEDEIPATFLPRQATTTWRVIAFALSLGCFALWAGWARTAARLQKAEGAWIALLDSPDPALSVVAAQSLGKFGPLSSAAMGKLRSAASSTTLPLRLAALKAMADHAAEFQSMRTEILRIQKVDENPLVRSEAGQVAEAIQRAGGKYSLAVFLFWGVVLAVCGAAATGGWHFWTRVRTFAV
jgi:serine/threonine protein kinase